MAEDLEDQRRRVADLERDRFDFGGKVLRSTDWVDDGRDSLTCSVEIHTPAQPHRLTFRVVFKNRTVELDRVSVAERMAPL